MRKQHWPKRDPIKNYFPLPNEIFSLGLSAGAIAVYGFLLHREDRRTYQCVASYRTIGEAVGMSVNTVRKYVTELEDRGLIRTERTTVTTRDDKIPPYLEKVCKRDPFSGKVVTGGIVTVKDSAWMMSYTFNRQPHFKAQPEGQLVGWIYGLFTDVPGDYVKKPMRECTGKEICMEWLYHIGVPEEDIAELAEHSANTVPVMMPYIDAFFMPRAFGDRPDIVPQGAVNFAFLGQFAETGRDTIFTTEYSMRTGMEAVYTLLNIDRGVPEVWGSTYDVRSLIDATVKLRDGKKITDMDLPFIQRVALKEVLKKIEGTDLEKFLKEYHAI